MDNYMVVNQSTKDRNMDFEKDGNRRALNRSIAAYNMDQVRTFQEKNI